MDKALPPTPALVPIKNASLCAKTAVENKPSIIMIKNLLNRMGYLSIFCLIYLFFVFDPELLLPELDEREEEEGRETDPLELRFMLGREKDPLDRLVEGRV